MPVMWDARIDEAKRQTYVTLALGQPLIGLAFVVLLLVQDATAPLYRTVLLVIGCGMLVVGLFGVYALWVLHRRRAQR